MPDAPHKIAYELVALDNPDEGWHPVGTWCLDYETAERLYHMLKAKHPTLAITNKRIAEPHV